MAQTLQNQITYAKSMNGIVTLSDGAGTTISNGSINTDNLDVDNFNASNFTANNVIVDYMQILRDSNPVVNAALGFTVDVGLLVQNMNFDDINRFFQIWDDTASSPVFSVDVSNNTVTFNASTVSFPNGTVIIDRTSTAAVIATLGATTNINNLLQNMYFDNSLRRFYFYLDNATNSNITIDVSGNEIEINPFLLAIDVTEFQINAGNMSIANTNLQFINSIVTFPTSTVSFNSFLPTSTLSATADNQLITRIFADSRYPRLAAQNAFTNLNTFNTNLPRSTITTATLDAQFVTKGIADDFYGRLAVTNTFAENCIFSKGILPRAASSATDIQIGGVNQLQYRTSPSAYNVSIGENAVQGYSAQPTWNVGQRNIGIGDGACKEIMGGNDNIGIGYRALKSGSGGIYGQTVTPFRCIAIGSNSQTNGLYGTDNISVGYNSLQNIGSGGFNICIGSSTGNAIANVGNNIIIGSGAGPTVVDNAMTIIGYQACGAATGGFNSGVALGSRASYSNAGGAGNSAVGADALYSNTTGFNNTAIGCFAGQTNPNNLNTVICLGRESRAEISQECVLGGNSFGTQVFLTLPQKVRLNCNQTVGAVATYNVSWRSNENIIVTTATTNFINLPIATYTDGLHVGATFNIIRSSGSTSNMYIVANGTETINYQGVSVTSVPIDSWVQSISVTCIGYTAGADMWAICRYNNRVTLATDANKLQTVTNSSNVNFPMCFTTIATTGYNNVYANASMYYNPSTSEMTVPNLTVTGILTGTATSSTFVTLTDRVGSSTTYSMIFSNGLGSILGALGGVSDLTYNPVTKLLNMGPTGSAQGTIQSYISKSTVYQYYEQSDLIIAATTLGAYYSYIPFTMKTAAAYSITLPVIDSASVGTQICFKRIGGSLQALSITAQGNQPTYLSGNARGTTTATNILISASQSCSTIVATETGDVGAGTFTNAAGSATITVVTQTSGTLSIGHIMNLNGNVRFITAYITGNGGASNGTYSISAAIATANTGQPYTTSLTYGWCVTTLC